MLLRYYEHNLRKFFFFSIADSITLNVSIIGHANFFLHHFLWITCLFNFLISYFTSHRSLELFYSINCLKLVHCKIYHDFLRSIINARYKFQFRDGSAFFLVFFHEFFCIYYDHLGTAGGSIFISNSCIRKLFSAYVRLSNIIGR